MRKRTVLPIVFLLGLADLFGTAGRPALLFESNKGQWPEQVSFKCDLPSGRLFLEAGRLTFVYYHPDDLVKAHPGHDGDIPCTQTAQHSIRCHAYRLQFDGCSTPSVSGSDIQPGYHNYFIGNNPATWASNVPLFGSVQESALYPGIDLKAYSKDGELKLDFIVAPHADPGRIRYSYDGLDAIGIRDGNLILQTSAGEITEQAPIAYQYVNGSRREISCHYILKNGQVSFGLGSYNTSLPLVIDPVIVASTYSGSNSKTYGHCATYDAGGNIYTGARCFGSHYPATTGAFDLLFSGGLDIVISKLNPTGSALVYATYLGGSADDYVHSMIVDNNDELFIYGSSTSENYPTTPGAFRRILQGTFSDIVVTHFNAAGSALMGSTYVGGSSADGRNDITVNLGDELKGEINIDKAGNIYIASFTLSANFPVTPSGYDPTYNGNQDAVVFCLDNSCSLMRWGTFLGDTANDAAYALKVLNNGEVIVAGATESVNFPVETGTYQDTYNGGLRDGWVARLNSSSLLASCFFGTIMEDEVFFVETDKANNIYLLGQTNATLPLTAGAYGTPGGHTFIARLNSTLTNLQVQTVLGGTATEYGIAPTAFMVDVCGNIYLSGFGNVSGYPLTPDAFYASDTIGFFYIAKLSRDADSLVFGSYYGGYHVDGGTSRFDKNGIIYQGVCQGGPGFPVLSNAYSPTTTQSWDVCVFKVDFQNNGAHARASVSPNTYGCVPFPVTFNNLSSGTSYQWDFGDGSPHSTSHSPVHLYTDTGNYQVRMIVTDTNTCNYADTLYLEIRVREPVPHQPLFDTLLCGLPAVELVAPLNDSGLVFWWHDGQSTPSIMADTIGLYWVQISNGSCNTIDSFLVSDLMLEPLGPDTLICVGQPVILQAYSNAASYLWSTGATSNAISVVTAGTYWVVASLASCSKSDSLVVSTVQGPVADLGKDTLLCPGTTPVVLLTAGALPSSVQWSTGDTAHSIVAQSEGDFWVQLYDGYCYDQDTINITVLNPVVVHRDSIFFCNFSDAVLDSRVDNAIYQWSTGEQTRSIRVWKNGSYWFEVTYNSVCVESDTVEVTGDFGQDLIFIPNAFTPNADGMNDIFLPVTTDVHAYDLQVFDRWGQLIFATTDPTSGWDGKLEGRLVQTGVYTYKVGYLTSCSESRVVKTGCVLVAQ